MLSVSFVCLYKRLLMRPRIYDIACKISHHLEVRGQGNFNWCLHLVVYDDSIGITIEDNYYKNILNWNLCWLHYNISYSSSHLLMIMANFDNFIKYYPFSSIFMLEVNNVINESNEFNFCT